VTARFRTTAIDLNDGVTYSLVHMALGDPIREEIWLEPPGSTDPILVQRTDRKTLMRPTLKVKATSVLLLKDALETVRAEFFDQPNQVEWSPEAGVVPSEFFDTLPSTIPAINLDRLNALFALGRKVVPEWELAIWRRPYPGADVFSPVI